jgi:hypothetical protein
VNVWNFETGDPAQGGESKRGADNFGNCYLFVICDL